MVGKTVGTVLNRDDVDDVFEGKNVTGVVVALGGKTREVGLTLCQDGTKKIIAACKEHGVKYNEANLWKGTMDVIQHLDVVATEFIQEFPAM